MSIPDGKPKEKKKLSVRQERRVAGLVGGRVQPGSGSSMYAKGDVRRGGAALTNQDFLLECKRTERENLTVRGEWLSKITREALAVGKHPALSVELTTGDSLTERDWVMIPASMFARLLEEKTEPSEE